MKETVIDMDKNSVGEVELDEGVFSPKPNKALVYEIVKMHRACQRLGTAFTRNRALVSGTTAKMYRQKGTGRARHGDYRANIFVGGGKAFGPKGRDYSYSITKKARRAALSAALSIKKNEGKLMIVDAIEVPEIKTKHMAAVLEKLGVKSGLIVLGSANDKVEMSARNIPNVKLVRWEALNAYDLLKHEHALIEKGALGKVQEVLKQ